MSNIIVKFYRRQQLRVNLIVINLKFKNQFVVANDLQYY